MLSAPLERKLSVHSPTLTPDNSSDSFISLSLSHESMRSNSHIVMDNPHNSMQTVLIPQPQIPTSNTDSHTSLLTATCTMIIAAAGAGLLSFPYAAMTQGIMLNVILTIIFAALNYYTLTVIAHYALMYQQRSASETESDGADGSLTRFGIVNNDALVHRHCGESWAVCFSACIVVSQIGAMTGFLMIIAGFISQVLTAICLQYAAGNSGCAAMTDENIIILILAFTMLLPLSFLRSFHALSISTLIALATVITVAVLVVVTAVPVVNSSSAPTSVNYLISPRLSIFFGLNIVIFSLGNQTQCVPVISELSLKYKENSFYTNIIFSVSTIVCVIIYLLTGIFGYLQFGSDIKGNVLDNYILSEWMATTAKTLMAVHITLAFPILLYPCRSSLQFVLTKYYNHINITNNIITSIIQGIILVLIVAALAILFPAVHVVFSLCGATTSVTQMYVLPALLMIYDEHEPMQRLKGSFLLALAAVITVIGTTTVIYEMVQGNV